ncbi:TerB family tellurite resistance protein [Mucilaginibacter sp. cycad4]|uniref:TerB family tellurite resistance protein n=1 Tax=Mucilaginibacter sp. cycad4 TaxID=3342096 RepID=UPI002AAB0E80|nr:TerB family tellurite resistance protein [Mucilaginibacter gossypii]WPU97826.1 TerB family tellurite resistance protein [Mucilaginibacter gossypii]
MGSIKIWLRCICVLLCTLSFQRSKAQDQDIQQLILDIEKLTQFKAILSDMQQGYSILTQGYGQVKDLAQGNFNLHSVFLNGLMQVNPEVAKYARVADIIADEISILSEYRKAYRQFQNSGSFNADELDYLARVYGQLTSAALNDVNDLANIITASKLRMSDDERLSAIDRIYASSNDKLSFLRDFNRRTNILLVQRQQEQNEVNNLKTLYP